jgi:hypothetical protein
MITALEGLYYTVGPMSADQHKKMENTFVFREIFILFRRNFATVFREIKLKISRNKTILHEIIGNSSRFKNKNTYLAPFEQILTVKKYDSYC